MYSTHSHLHATDLDRSPSLSSNSSGADSAISSELTTPNLPSPSSFPSAQYPSSNSKDVDNPLGRLALADLSLVATGMEAKRTIRTSVSSRAGLAGMGLGGGGSPQSSSSSSPWSAGHRTGAGSASFDSARARFGSPASSAQELGGLGRSPSIRPTTTTPAPSTPTEAGGRTPTSSWRGSTPTPLDTSTQHSSPTRRTQSPFTTTSSPRSGSISPTKSSLPFPPSSSPTKAPPSSSPFSSAASPSSRSPLPSVPQGSSSPDRHHQHQRTTSIFSTRDLPSPSSADDGGLGRQGSVRGVGMGMGMGMGHRRAMTLPHSNGLGAAPSPVEGMGMGMEAEVTGLPNRLRLSRPADSYHPALGSTFSPSAVYSSSHNLALSSSSSPSLSTATTEPKPKPKPGALLPSVSIKALDKARTSLIAWEYLTRCRETQEWLQEVLPEKVLQSEMWVGSQGGGEEGGGGTKEFEQSLRNGYALAHLARRFGGVKCQGGIYNDPVRHYRHTENINIFFAFQDEIGIWDVFRFETVDLYDGKNLPKVIFCLHALSKWLYKMGMIDEGVRNLEGLVEFSDAELQATDRALDGVRMPDFGGIDKKLNKQEKVVETEEQRLDRLLAEQTPTYIAFQSQARGALARRQFQHLKRQRQRQLAAAAAEAEVEQRRLIAEREEEERRRRRQLEEEEQRRLQQQLEQEELEQQRYKAAVEEAARTMVRFQALARGALVRREFWSTIDGLHERTRAFQGVQAQVRGALARGKVLREIQRMRGTEGFVVRVQAAVRAKLAREAYGTRKAHLRKAEVVRSVGSLQSLARAALVRRRIDTQKQALGFVEPDVVGIQAQTRGFLGRGRFLAWRDHIYRHEEEILDLQALVRGLLARRRYWAIHEHFHRNMSSVVKLQAIARSRRQGDQYRQLRMGTNVPASTIKNFVRLLDDSEFDYRNEVLVDSMRKQLTGMVREVQNLEDDVRDLDTKIALLVKNKITHEMARAVRSGGDAGGLAPLQRKSLLAAAKDPFAAEALDRQTARKLELYQQLFWHVQTNPTYFARLLANPGRERGDKAQKALERIAIVIFGHAQAQREEFLLLKLFQATITEELKLVPDVGVFVRGNLAFVRLLMQYGRGIQATRSLQSMLNGPVKQIIATHTRPLLTDPVAVYQALLDAEEDRTGNPSPRPREVDWRFAVADKATHTDLANHLKTLRAATELLLRAIFASTASLPFGIRYIIREVFRSLRARFPEQPEGEMLRVAGHLLYYRFIQPAIVAPETFDIVEGAVPDVRRQNLAECAKMINQISAGRAFEKDQPWMVGFNGFIEVKTAEFATWVRDVIYVSDAEVHFRADEWLDAKTSSPLVLWISPNDIYTLHSAIMESVEALALHGQDPVQEIVSELGGAPIAAAGGELSRARAEEIALQLTTRLSPRDDPNAGDKLLFQQAKRRIIAVLKVHHGADLVEIFAKAVTRQDEEAWHRIVQEEVWEEQRQAQASRRSIIAPVDDLRRLSYQQLKIAAIQDVMVLRQKGLVSQQDKFQALLDSIAQDIKSKHHRRVQRSNELATIQATLSSLQGKKTYIADQIRSYHEYIDQSMAGIQKKTKKGFTLPWSLQAGHQRQLDRKGKSYQYGSYKYTAKALYDKGVLLSIDQTSPTQFKDLYLTVSSNEIGVFEVSVESKDEAPTTVQLKLEDLLESQFAAKQTISIGDKAKVNLNLLVDLINRKFSS